MADITECLFESGLAKHPDLIRRNESDFDLEEAIAKIQSDAHRMTELRMRSALANAYIADKVTRNTLPDENGKRRLSPVEAVRSLLVRNLFDKSNHMNVSSLKKGYAAVLHAPLEKAAEAFKLTVTGGSRRPELMQEAARVAFGAQAKNAEANEIGTAIRQALDKGYKILRDLGVESGYIENYLPQQHVRQLLMSGGRSDKSISFKQNADAARARWKNYVKERLDRSKMLDADGNVLDDEGLEELLDYVFSTITTQGKNKVNPPTVLQSRVRPASPAKFGMERILHFKNADAALQYADEYGVNDWWGNVTNHIESMATAAAVHRMFGPDPEFVFGQWKNWALKEDTLFDPGSIENIWVNINGFQAGTDTQLAHVFNAARDTLSASMMGSAVVVSITDTVPMLLNAALNNMKVGRMLGNLQSYANEGDRAILSRTLGHIEFGISSLATAQRFEETMGRGVTRRMSDAVYRMQGMTGMMNALRHTWMMEFSTMLGENMGKEFDDLPKGLRSFLDTYGLALQWDLIRQSPTVDYHGSKLVDIASLNNETLKAELLGAIYTERDMAILHPDERVRALLNQGKNPGTIIGEMLRSAGQFKTFPATVIMHAMMRYAMSNRLDLASRAAYTTGMLVGMTMLGAVALQLKEMIKGRDPRDMTTKDFALRAFAQGGALPGAAELILDGQTRHGSSKLEATLGPLGGTLSNAMDAGAALSRIMLSDDPADAKIDFSKEIEQLSRVVPGSSLWYARLGWDRLVRDQLLQLTGPEYGMRQRQKEINRYNEFKQNTWWGYDSDPEAPDFSAMFGD